MADPVVETPVQATPVVADPAPVVAPIVVETPPVVAPVETPAIVETPKVEPAKVETLLADALDKNPVEVKPADGEVKVPPVEGDQSKTESNQSDEPAPLPVYDTFTVPEGVTLDDERVKKFTEILGDLETKSKAEHALVQEFGQKAVDFHVSEVKKAVDDVNTYIKTAWERQKTEWKDSFLSDPDIGGNRFQTTVDSARTFIRTHGGNADQQAEFRNLMETSGLGNHPAMIRLLANAGRAMSEGQPLAAVKPVSQSKSKTQTLYGG